MHLEALEGAFERVPTLRDIRHLLVQVRLHSHNGFRFIPRSAIREQLEAFNNFCLNMKARIWPGLSYVRHIYSPEIHGLGA